MRNIFFTFIALLFTISLSKAQEIKHHPFSGRWVLSLEGGLAAGKTDYMSTINSYNVNGLVEYFFPTRDQNIFGLRLIGGAANLKEKMIGEPLIVPLNFQLIFKILDWVSAICIQSMMWSFLMYSVVHQ